MTGTVFVGDVYLSAGGGRDVTVYGTYCGDLFYSVIKRTCCRRADSAVRRVCALRTRAPLLADACTSWQNV